MTTTYRLATSAFFYGPNTSLLDARRDVGATNREEVLEEAMSLKPRSSNTLGGSYSPPFSAQSTRFGNISFDPEPPLTAPSYHTQASVSYVCPADQAGMKLVAGLPLPNGNVVEIEFKFIEGTLLGDGAALYDDLHRRDVTFARSCLPSS